MENNKKKIKYWWLKKFAYAIRGFYFSLKEETSLVVHFIMAIIVLILATILHAQMSYVDWAIIILLISIIIGMELLNTAIENLVDIVSFKYNYNAKKIKDIAAAATLTLTLGAVAIGLVIFIPHLIVFFQSF